MTQFGFIRNKQGLVQNISPPSGGQSKGFFSEVGDVISGAGHFIEGVEKDTVGIINHVVQGGEDLSKNIINKGSGIISKGESIISTPLLLIAGGLALFLVLGRKEIVQTAGQIGGQIAQNPAILG